MRKHYLEYGLPINARTTARMLDNQFPGQGGNKYLHPIFSGGPVTQGSRLANIRTPATLPLVSVIEPTAYWLGSPVPG
jgi:tRNA 2-thiouridine synthesizing protein E